MKEGRRKAKKDNGKGSVVSELLNFEKINSAFADRWNVLLSKFPSMCDMMNVNDGQ